MFDKEFEISNPKLKAFVNNEKLYKLILGTMFVFSSVCYSAIVAEACRDSMASESKILFLNIIWVALYVISAIIYIHFIGYSPLAFAVSTYFVADYTIGSLLSAVYDMHFLSVTNIIKYAFVFVITILYLWLVWVEKKGYVEKKVKLPNFKNSFFSIWCDLFFPATGAITAEIALITYCCIKDEMRFLKIIILITTIILLLITVLIYGVHFAHGNIMIYTLCSMALMICTYIFVAVGIADGSSDVTISFWYSLFDALNLIT